MSREGATQYKCKQFLCCSKDFAANILQQISCSKYLAAKILQKISCSKYIAANILQQTPAGRSGHPSVGFYRRKTNPFHRWPWKTYNQKFNPLFWKEAKTNPYHCILHKHPIDISVSFPSIIINQFIQTANITGPSLFSSSEIPEPSP